ncbi:hypothetical protein TELCIR_19839 [Teladorsagia circumcincta]|uniref:Amidase domain-containing protein n=1 Tax=Teladorsagia circumcincta TaxID=45464 RepID=A0A2G9TL53_TELCI|nr:hypothetical protein TELCIR_19839 [Teladorsagia circumcincta]
MPRSFGWGKLEKEAMGICSTVIYGVSRIYFLMITVIFRVVNYFKLTKSKPLLGIPFTVKDSLEVEGQVITCGIYAQKGVKRTATAEVIKSTTRLIVVPRFFHIEDENRLCRDIGPFKKFCNPKALNQVIILATMEAAGAILIAVTNVPEACYWVETSNGIYGQTKNPYDTRRSVGGSSGGEGALISAAGSVK